MRTAEDYMKQFNISKDSDDTLGSRCDDIEEAIITAQKEAIEECAENMKMESYSIDEDGKEIVNSDKIFIASLGKNKYLRPSKQSILSLINKLQ